MEEHINQTLNTQTAFKSRKKLLVIGAIIFFAIIIALIIFLAITMPSKYKSVKTDSVGSNNIKQTPAYLYFTPPSIKLQQTTQKGISSNIVLDTQGKGVEVVQIELSFDPKVISNVKIEKTEDSTSLFSGFKVGQAVADQASGKAFIALGVNNKDAAKSGKGALATVKYDIINKSDNKKSVIEITPLTALITQGKALRFEKTDLEISFP